MTIAESRRFVPDVSANIDEIETAISRLPQRNRLTALMRGVAFLDPQQLVWMQLYVEAVREVRRTAELANRYLERTKKASA